MDQHDSQPKYADKNPLLPPGKTQPHQRGQREQIHHHIQHQINAGKGNIIRHFCKTGLAVVVVHIPVGVQGHAHQERGDDEAEQPGERQRDGGEDGDLQVRGRREAQVEGQHGELCEADVEQAEEVGWDKKTAGGDEGGRVDVPDVFDCRIPSQSYISTVLVLAS